MQPLVQSTDETPDGPLTLRVFQPATGESCSGDLYADDGRSFDFRNGAYLRLHVTCSIDASGALTVSIPQREGNFKPWWSTLRIEAVGFVPTRSQATVEGRTTALEKTKLGWSATVADTGKAQTIELQ
jgi:alpha-glucosidase